MARLRVRAPWHLRRDQCAALHRRRGGAARGRVPVAGCPELAGRARRARGLLGTRYLWAATGQRAEDGAIRYRSRRGRHGPGTKIDALVDPSTSVTDPLSTFLTARWALHQRWLGRTLRLPNDHAPWRLHHARLLRLDDELVAAAGLPGVTERPPESVLYSPGVRARFGLPSAMRVDGT